MGRHERRRTAKIYRAAPMKKTIFETRVNEAIEEMLADGRITRDANGMLSLTETGQDSPFATNILAFKGDQQ